MGKGNIKRYRMGRKRRERRGYTTNLQNKLAYRKQMLETLTTEREKELAVRLFLSMQLLVTTSSTLIEMSMYHRVDPTGCGLTVFVRWSKKKKRRRERGGDRPIGFGINFQVASQGPSPGRHAPCSPYLDFRGRNPHGKGQHD